jgi:asparagine synthetase B (glutamine-hydrolysing)
MTDIERIEHARWILERNIAWIAQAEVKVAVIISLDAAMLSALAAAYTANNSKTAWAILLSIMCGLVMLGAFISSFMVVKPRTGGPDTSYVFFGKIVMKKRDAFSDDFAKVTVEQYLRDLTDQIHRNAEIACEKHGWVRLAAMWSFAAGAFWIPSVALLVKA